nr:hypothetical protein [Candidatus Sigynarchaeota archaeon]
ILAQSSNILTLQNTAGISVNWTLTDSSGGGDYTVTCQGIPIPGYINISWTNGVQISVPVTTTTYGTFTYALIYQDMNLFYGTTGSIIVTVEDVPVITGSPSPLIVQEASISSVLTWVLQDHLGAGHYSIYINGSSYITNQVWINNTAFNVTIDTNRGISTFNYSIVYDDNNGINGAQGWVLVTVGDKPYVVITSANQMLIQNSTSIEINWTLTDSTGGGNYTILRNGVAIPGRTNISWTSNIKIGLTIDTNEGLGSTNYTMIYYDMHGFNGIQGTIIVVVNDIPVIVLRPANNTLAVQNATVAFDWRLSDNLGGGTYTITRNGTAVPGHSGVAWISNATISLLVNTNQGCGEFDYQIVFTDMYGTPGVSERVTIHVEDIPIVILSPTVSMIIESASPYPLIWALQDEMTGGGLYSVYVDGTPMATNQSWSNLVPVIMLIPATVGSKNVSLQFCDANGISGITSTIAFIVEDYPTVVTAPQPVTIGMHATGVTLSWTLHDSIAGGTYSLYRNGTRLLSGQPWTSDVALVIPITETNLPEGQYVFALHFWDSNGNKGNVTSVIVTVSGDARPFIIVFLNQYFLLIVIIGAGIAVTVAIVAFNSKKIKKASTAPALPKTDLTRTLALPKREEVPMPSTTARSTPSAAPTGTSQGWPATGPKTPPPGTAFASWDIAGTESKPESRTTPTAANADVIEATSEQEVVVPAIKDTEMEQPAAPVQEEQPRMPLQEEQVNAPEVPKEPVQEQPANIAPVPASKPNFSCIKCKKQYTMDGARDDVPYACPTCNEILAHVVYCPSCSKKMAMKQDDFVKFKGKQIQCPACKKPFKV